MGTSYTLFRVNGIAVKVHWSFLLILVYGVIAFGGRSDSLMLSALYGVFVTLLLFVCVTLHEFGHAAVAKHYHIKVPSITLLPIGGLANLESIPEKPSQEFAIAIAGPAVNIGLAVLLAPIALLIVGIQTGLGSPMPSIEGLRREMMAPGLLNVVIYLISTNLLLAFFNLLPAFPMDGGRMLRALLAVRLSYVLATRIAVYVGRAMAILFAFLGLFGGGVFLLFIAFFVYVGGGVEREAVENRARLRNIPAERALSRATISLYTSELIGRAVDLVTQNYQTDFPVRDLSGRYVGLLTQPELVQALRDQGRNVRVVDVMTPAANVPVCTIDDDLATVWERMMKTNTRVVAVMENEDLLGMITLENLSMVAQLVGPASRGAARRSLEQDEERSSSALRGFGNDA